MSLLTIINRAQALLNLPITTTVVTNTGEAQKQLLALCNTAGDVLMRDHDWQALRTEGSFVTTATEVQTNSALPADFDRFINNSFWNRSTTDPLIGPISEERYAAFKAQNVSSVYQNFLIRNGYFVLFPAPSAGQSIYYAYVSNKWCQSSGGTAQAQWAADTDTARIPEHLMILGLVWRFQEAKGLDYSQRYDEYEREKSRVIGRDGARRNLNVGGPTSQNLGRGRVPEGTW